MLIDKIFFLLILNYFINLRYKIIIKKYKYI